ncbi:MAG: hypothetical protein HYZ65_14095 [Burkholderiales bacterium]|nr:hypothetical protein [Burkholderiales bacterium]
MLCAPIAAHAENHPSKAKLSKSNKSAAPASPVVKDEDEAEPDIQQSKNAEYKCELGNSLTMYSTAEDQQHMAMRWKKRLYRLTRVETTTGAQRFENHKAGFIWIGIPAKGLLLDSHKGQQLANECKTAEPVLAGAETADKAK